MSSMLRFELSTFRGHSGVGDGAAVEGAPPKSAVAGISEAGTKLSMVFQMSDSAQATSGDAASSPTCNELSS